MLFQRSSKDLERSGAEKASEIAEEKENELESEEGWYSEPTYYGLIWHKLNVSQERIEWEEDM